MEEDSNLKVGTELKKHHKFVKNDKLTGQTCSKELLDSWNIFLILDLDH